MAAKSESAQKTPFPSQLCVWERTEDPQYLEIRQEILQLFNGDEYMAKVMAVFKMFQRRKVRDLWDAGGKGDLWITTTARNIHFWTLETVSVRKIVDCLKALEDQGYLQVKRVSGWKDASSYLLNVKLLNDRLKALPVVLNLPPTSRYAQMHNDEVPSSAQTTSPLCTDDTPICTDAEHISNLSRDLSEPSPNNPLPPSEKTQEQNTSAEEEHWADAATAASMLLSYLRVAKAPGLIKANSNSARVAIMENLARRLKGHQVLSDRIGPVVDFFCNWYLSRPSDDKPHYVSIVGGKFLDMLTGDASLDTDPPDLPSTPVSLPPIDLQPISPKSPPDIPPASPHNGLPPLALRWNEVVHSGPPVVAWKEQSNGDFLLRTLMSDLAFQRESETALAKAEKLCAAKHPKGSYLTFGWFIKPGKWCEVLNGQHDWLLGDGPAQQPKKGMGALIEQFKAECEAKKGDKNLDSHVE